MYHFAVRCSLCWSKQEKEKIPRSCDDRKASDWQTEDFMGMESNTTVPNPHSGLLRVVCGGRLQEREIKQACDALL